MSTRPLIPALGAALLLAGALTGCATPAGDAAPASPTPTASATAVVDVQAAWLDGGSTIGLVIAGSSTCAPMADAAVYDAGVLSVELLEPVDAPCTRDSVPRGIPVMVPAGVDAAEDVRVEVRSAQYSGSVDLPGVAGLTPGGGLETGAASAGWAGADVFAMMTWGSSSCPPQIADAAVSGPTEITVNVATPPADQVCTADMAPRVTVVRVDGAAAGTAYEAVLRSEGAEPTRVPIAGTP